MTRMMIFLTAVAAVLVWFPVAGVAYGFDFLEALLADDAMLGVLGSAIFVTVALAAWAGYAFYVRMFDIVTVTTASEPSNKAWLRAVWGVTVLCVATLSGFLCGLEWYGVSLLFTPQSTGPMIQEVGYMGFPVLIATCIAALIARKIVQHQLREVEPAE